jgi:hypothetical protein
LRPGDRAGVGGGKAGFLAPACGELADGITREVSREQCGGGGAVSCGVGIGSPIGVGIELFKGEAGGLETCGLEVLLRQSQRGFEAGARQQACAFEFFDAGVGEERPGDGFLALAVSFQELRVVQQGEMNRLTDAEESIGICLSFDDAVGVRVEDLLEDSCGFAGVSARDQIADARQRLSGEDRIIDVGRDDLSCGRVRGGRVNDRKARGEDETAPAEWADRG